MIIELLKVLPRTAISRMAGRLASLRLPRRLQAAELRLFARLAGVDLDELDRPLESFGSLQELFTRPLPPGARVIDPAADSLVAPCDGRWGASGVVEGGALCQVKGRTYTAASLLGDATRAADFENGCYATFYLAPHNYHRFHTPCDLELDAADHIPGSLWPVNDAGLRGVENLFARNERIAAYARVPGGTLCMVAVGAVMVGKVRLTFDDLTTNLADVATVRRRTYSPPVPVGKGEEWGWFEFGSTIVLLATPATLSLDQQEPGTPLRLGERIGRLL